MIQAKVAVFVGAKFALRQNLHIHYAKQRKCLHSCTTPAPGMFLLDHDMENNMFIASALARHGIVLLYLYFGRVVFQLGHSAGELSRVKYQQTAV